MQNLGGFIKLYPIEVMDGYDETKEDEKASEELRNGKGVVDFDNQQELHNRY